MMIQITVEKDEPDYLATTPRWLGSLYLMSHTLPGYNHDPTMIGTPSWQVLSSPSVSPFISWFQFRVNRVAIMGYLVFTQVASPVNFVDLVISIEARALLFKEVEVGEVLHVPEIDNQCYISSILTWLHPVMPLMNKWLCCFWSSSIGHRTQPSSFFNGGWDQLWTPLVPCYITLNLYARSKPKL